MGSNGVIVNGGNTSLQYVSMNQNNPMQGMLRINGTEMQVFDGGGWQNVMTSYATVELDYETKQLLDYIRKKQAEEKEIEALSNDHPAVRIAKENLNKIKAELEQAEKQLKATVILSKDHESA